MDTGYIRGIVSKTGAHIWRAIPAGTDPKAYATVLLNDFALTDAGVIVYVLSRVEYGNRVPGAPSYGSHGLVNTWQLDRPGVYSFIPSGCVYPPTVSDLDEDAGIRVTGVSRRFRAPGRAAFYGVAGENLRLTAYTAKYHVYETDTQRLVVSCVTCPSTRVYEWQTIQTFYRQTPADEVAANHLPADTIYADAFHGHGPFDAADIRAQVYPLDAAAEITGFDPSGTPIYEEDPTEDTVYPLPASPPLPDLSAYQSFAVKNDARGGFYPNAKFPSVTVHLDKERLLLDFTPWNNALSSVAFVVKATSVDSVTGFRGIWFNRTALYHVEHLPEDVLIVSADAYDGLENRLCVCYSLLSDDCGLENGAAPSRTFDGVTGYDTESYSGVDVLVTAGIPVVTSIELVGDGIDPAYGGGWDIGKIQRGTCQCSGKRDPEGEKPTDPPKPPTVPVWLVVLASVIVAVGLALLATAIIEVVAAAVIDTVITAVLGEVGTQLTVIRAGASALEAASAPERVLSEVDALINEIRASEGELEVFQVSRATGLEADIQAQNLQWEISRANANARINMANAEDVLNLYSGR